MKEREGHNKYKTYWKEHNNYKFTFVTLRVRKTFFSALALKLKLHVESNADKFRSQFLRNQE